MGFLAMYFIYGMYFLVPIDRAHFPVVYETHYPAGSPADEAWRFTLVGDRAELSVRHFLQGVQWDSSYFDTKYLGPDGMVRAECRDPNCDYREDGDEYRYEGGQITQVVIWRDGNPVDSTGFLYQNGLLVGSTDGSLTLTWKAGRIDSLGFQSGDLRGGVIYRYSPAGDTVRALGIDFAGERSGKDKVFIMREGLPALRIEYEDGTLVSSTTYRYGPTAALGKVIRKAPPRFWRYPVDGLGRPAGAASFRLGYQPGRK